MHSRDVRKRLSITIFIVVYEKARAANIMFSVFVPVSRSLLCECDCNTPEQGRSGVPCHRYDRSPLEPRTQQFRLRYPFSIVIVSWKVTSTWLILARGQSAVVFLLSEKAHLFEVPEVIEKLSRSFSENQLEISSLNQ